MPKISRGYNACRMHYKYILKYIAAIYYSNIFKRPIKMYIISIPKYIPKYILKYIQNIFLIDSPMHYCNTF